MSSFTYDKVGQYGPEVVDKFISSKGVVKAIDGKNYTIDISRNSVFAKFKTFVEKDDFESAEVWLKENEFDVVAPKKRDIKFAKLGWTEIEKKVLKYNSIVRISLLLLLSLRM